MPRKSIYELYELLPKTNCGECGMSCMAFAGLLLARDVRPGDCPVLEGPEHEASKRELLLLLGEGTKNEITGLIVDDHLCTGCGACVNVCPVHGANNREVALGKGPRWRYDASTTPWVTFTSPEVARVGVLESDAPRGAMVAHLPLSHVDRAITDGRTDGFVKLIAGPKRVTRTLFGGQIVGATIVADRAGEMIHGPTIAARLGMFVGRLAQVTTPYPTWSTAIQQAAGQFFQPVSGIEARPAQRT